MFPELPDRAGTGLSPGTFLSCSADNTVRLWQLDEWTCSQNILNTVSSALKMHSGSGGFLETRFFVSLSITAPQELQNVIYIEGSAAASRDPEFPANVNTDKAGDGQMAETRTGIRTICLSPDGKHLASGDRNGMLRYDKEVKPQCQGRWT